MTVNTTLERPAALRWAVILWRFAVAAGIVESIIGITDAMRHQQVGPALGVNVGLRAAVYGVALVLIARLASGRGGARIAITLLLSVIGLASMLVPAAIAISEGRASSRPWAAAGWRRSSSRSSTWHTSPASSWRPSRCTCLRARGSSAPGRHPGARSRRRERRSEEPGHVIVVRGGRCAAASGGGRSRTGPPSVPAGRVPARSGWPAGPLGAGPPPPLRRPPTVGRLLAHTGATGGA